jgi:hypothetical protein
MTQAIKPPPAQQMQLALVPSTQSAGDNGDPPGFDRVRNGHLNRNRHMVTVTTPEKIEPVDAVAEQSPPGPRLPSFRPSESDQEIGQSRKPTVTPNTPPKPVLQAIGNPMQISQPLRSTAVQQERITATAPVAPVAPVVQPAPAEVQAAAPAAALRVPMAPLAPVLQVLPVVALAQVPAETSATPALAVDGVATASAKPKRSRSVAPALPKPEKPARAAAAHRPEKPVQPTQAKQGMAAANAEKTRGSLGRKRAEFDPYLNEDGTEAKLIIRKRGDEVPADKDPGRVQFNVRLPAELIERMHKVTRGDDFVTVQALLERACEELENSNKVEILYAGDFMAAERSRMSRVRNARR